MGEELINGAIFEFLYGEWLIFFSVREVECDVILWKSRDISSEKFEYV